MKLLMKSRCWSLLLSFSLIFCSSASAQLEQVEAEPTPELPAPSAAPLLKVQDLAIPKTLGKIDERFTGQSQRWVIHIQDVHAHYTAQENIAAIVDQLNAVYGIKTVAMEGGWGSTSFPQSWGLPSSREKQMLARALLEDDFLSGPAYAALFSQSPINLIGIEDAGLYEENRKIYVEHLAERDQVSAKVDGVQKSIVDRKKAVFNPELQSFDLALTDFREGKKADKFLPSLLQMAQANGVDLADLDQVMLFEQTLVAEKALSKEKLDSEAQRLMQSFKRNRLSFEELLRSGKIPADKLEAYPESKQYLALMHLQDQIDHREFFSQIDEAISRVKERLFTSDEEKALDARSERFLLAKKIILFQATPDDLKAYEVQQSEIDSEIASDGLSEPLNLGLGFYEIAKKRDKIFFEKITSDERLGGDIAVVTGGFHTEGLSEKMKEAGISYAVVTPDLANEAPNEKLYFQRLQQNMVSMQTLSEMRNRIFATTPENQEVTVFDSAFPLAVIRIQETKNIREGTSLIENAFSEGAALTGPGIRRAAVAGLAPGITDQDFINFTPQERLEAFQRWADSSEKSETSIFLVLEGKSLTEALQDPINQESVEIFKQNANNSAVVLGTDFPTDILGGRSRVLIKSDVNTVEDFMQEPIADIRLKQVNNHAAGLEGELLKEGRILVLPVKIKGELLRGILIVASAVARGEVQISSDPEIQSQFWSAVQELIAQYPTLEALRTAA